MGRSCQFLYFFPNQHSSDPWRTISLPDTPVANDVWSSGDDRLCIPTNQDDVNSEDYLNFAIHPVTIENPQLCVSPSSLMLDSTPCASEEQWSYKLLVDRTALSTQFVPGVRPYVFESKPRSTLAVCACQADSLHQVANEGCSDIKKSAVLVWSQVISSSRKRLSTQPQDLRLHWLTKDTVI